ncbi:MAG: hypothetical protein CR967_05810 [Proteobacteria bacterium]|nr:MAG: hypothetical protein CR967_05810 [Pseudomonadota bacterium]
MSKYLYGASVQGIQNFIFKTNKLKEIIGASKLVEDLGFIRGIIENNKKARDTYSVEGIKNKPIVILSSAGNLRIIFENKEDAKIMVKKFPKEVMQKAYGITISQALIPFDDTYERCSKKLEQRLKFQRNKPPLPLDLHFSILKQNPKTAKPVVKKIIEEDEEIYLDKATKQKIDRFKQFVNEKLDLENLSNSKNKIAIIHADGNGLGKIVQNMDEKELKSFSLALDKATIGAKEEASKVVKGFEKNHREIILSGDDLTIVCNASYALEFTRNFLELFEQKTKNIYKNDSLSACAGIAYANEKYPLHYAFDLAEALCSYAKKDSRKIDDKYPPSSLMFHNIRSSHVKSYSKFVDDELTLGTDEKILCNFGSYFLHEYKDRPQIDVLLKTIDDFRKDGSPISRLREWLSELDNNRTYADNELKRINQITTWKSENLSNLYKNLSLENLIVTKDGAEKTPIYDILQILAVEDKGDKK